MITVDGAALDAVLTPAALGRDTDPTIVFLHEGLGSIELWRGFPAAVREATGRPATLVYSRAGYGRSGPAVLPRPVDYMHHEADVVLPELLAAFGIERPLLIGHSDGASIALLYAGAGHAVAGLVLLAPHVFVEDVTVEAIAAARDDYATTDLRRRMARYHDDVDATFRGWNDIWLDPTFRAWNIEDRLPAITAPVLLVQGDADPFGTIAQLDAIEKQVAGDARRVEVPGARHSPHLDAPDVTLDAVAAFARGVVGR